METFDFGYGPVAAHKHVYGGGWVADTAIVDPSAYVGSSALVYDRARVYGRARVYDRAQVYGRAQVYDSAQVYGNALVYGNAQVCGNAQVYDRALVYDRARVYGRAQVYDSAQVYGNAQVCGGIISEPWHVIFVSGFSFGITVTNSQINIGCQSKSHADFLAVTKPQAIEMGLPEDQYAIIKSIVTAAIKMTTKND